MGVTPTNKTRSPGARLIQGTGWSFVAIAADYAVSLLLTFLVARPLGPAAYGLVPLVASITEVPRMILTSALGTSMAKHLAPLAERDPGRSKQVLCAGLALMAPFCGAATLLFVAGAGAFALVFRQPELAGLLKIAAVGLFAAGLMSFAQAAFQGLNRLDLLAGVSVVNSGTRLVLTLLLVHVVPLGARGALWGTTLGYAMAVAAFLPLLWSRWLRPVEAVGAPPWVPLLKYAEPLLFSCVAFFAINRVDVVILGLFAHDPAEVGYLGLAASALALPLAVAQAVANAAFPAVSALAARKDGVGLQHLYDQLCYWLTFYAVPACVVVALLAGPLLDLALPDYAPVARLLQVLAPLILLKALVGLCTGGYLIAAGYASEVARLNVAAAVANVLLDLALIPVFGAMGSAAGSLVVHSGMWLWSLRLTRRKLGINFAVPWGPLGGGLVMVLVVARASSSEARAGIGNVLLRCLLGLGGFLAAAFLVGHRPSKGTGANRVG